MESWRFFGPSREVESLIRTCWEITVSLRAIGPFYVYVMHMHGLEQSSGTRYLVPHKCTAEASLHCGGRVRGPKMRSAGLGLGGGGCWTNDAGGFRGTSIKHPAVPHLRIHCSRNSEITAENYQVMAECITADVGGVKEVRAERLLYRWCRAKRRRRKKSMSSRSPSSPRLFSLLFLTSASIVRIRAHPRRRSDSGNHSKRLPPLNTPSHPSTPHLSQQIKWRGISFCSSWWAVTRGKGARVGEGGRGAEMLSVQNNETFHDTSLSAQWKKKSHYLQKRF